MKRSVAWLIVDVALGVTALGGAALLVMPGRADMAPPPARIPATELEENDRGERLATLEDEAWRAAHRAAHLPEPGEMRQVDPVPVGVLVDAVKRWIEQKDGDAIGEAGEVYLALEHHEAAVRFFAAAAALQPNVARWHYFLGAELQGLGHVLPAIKALERARELEPDYPTTHARLGDLHLERGDFRAAETSFDRYCALQPHVSLGYVGLGRVALEQREWMRARRSLERAVETTPNDFRAWRMLSRAHAGLGEQAKAIEAARRADRLPMYRGWLTFDPRLGEAHERARTQRALENKLRTLTSEHDMAEAIALLEELARRRPKDSEVLAMLAQRHLALGSLERARGYSDQALALDPSSASNLTLKAMVHLTADEYALAHMALDDALQQDPSYALAWELRGRALLLQDRPAEAAEALGEAARLDAKAMGARYMLAYALAKLGRRAEAAAELDAILEVEPEHAGAQQLRRSLQKN